MKNRTRRSPSGDNISPPARIMMRAGLILSCLMLSASLLIAVYAGEPTLHNRFLCSLYAQLYRAPQGVLLVISLGALCVDGLIKQ